MKLGRNRWSQQQETSNTVPREWQSSWSCSLQICWAWCCAAPQRRNLCGLRSEKNRIFWILEILLLHDYSHGCLSHSLKWRKQVAASVLYSSIWFWWIISSYADLSLPLMKLSSSKSLYSKVPFTLFSGYSVSVYSCTLKSKYYMIECSICRSHSISIFT